eukprot:CAMPEP_0119286582 /NCGR_PEP_ID=MMETSP1329-20130426/34102_1 /TAXON_ID=114041 /ORGANISM="Genus nov. species nov., Strain RCC1024" /LENGTH=174 /DNA_ID=CAMNT_0007287321 /DNA_START=60 /DNA_END=581 /DNA_ORIENTATION=+
MALRMRCTLLLAVAVSAEPRGGTSWPHARNTSTAEAHHRMVSVRVRGCGPRPADFLVDDHCGGPEGERTCVHEYLERAYSHARYAPRGDEPPDLEYIPLHCLPALARATCADRADAPALGSFTHVGHVMMAYTLPRCVDPKAKREVVMTRGGPQKRCPRVPYVLGKSHVPRISA